MRQQTVPNSSNNWESVRQETIVGDRPPQRPQRLNLRQCKNRSSRDYNSIDDLSPEYTVLPFVKRLKILNERQKIVELQKALTTISMSVAGGSQDVSRILAPQCRRLRRLLLRVTKHLKGFLKSGSRKELRIRTTG